MNRHTQIVFLLGLCLLGCSAQAGVPTLTSQRVATGLNAPLFVTYAPGDFERVFIVQQCGQIKILKNGAVLGTNFLNIQARLICGGEMGLLGLAFHPDYESNGKFYLNYIDTSQRTVIAEYTVSANPEVANTTEVILLRFTQPFSNHNGGWMQFGPDGFLYIASGDGGSGGDPDERAQDITSQLLGKMLRIDVNGDDFPADPLRNYVIPPTNPFVGITGDDEIWAFGLRNPWRNSFDRLTGDLYIADVGQGLREEVDFQAGGVAGGQNYGWDCREGTVCLTSDVGCNCNTTPGLINPIHEYPQIGTDCSAITGGYVYRGCAIPGLQGTYFFGDYCRDQIWSFRYSGGIMTEFQERTAELDPAGTVQINTPASFGEDAYGEIYICDIEGGEIFKIIDAGSHPPDCNENDIVDTCDIAVGTSQDNNSNSVPDECEVPIPTLSECGLAGMVALLLCAGATLIARRRKPA